MKKHFLLGTIVGAGTACAVGLLKNYTKNRKQDESSCCNCSGGFNGDCKCNYNNKEEPVLLYKDDCGQVVSSPVSILDDYVGKPMPVPEKLTLYFAELPRLDAEKLCKTDNKLKLTPSNGYLSCDWGYRYIGCCLPSKELFLWAKANNKTIAVKTKGDVYVKDGHDDKWYADLEII